MANTARLRNINPLGRVDLPLVYREGDVDGPGDGCLEAGEEFDVSPEHAEILLQQAGNYEPVDAAAIAIDKRIEANAFRHTKPAAKKTARKRAPAKKSTAAEKAAPAKAVVPDPGAASSTEGGDQS